MTRGKFVYIIDNLGNSVVSDEFNGDMGIDQENGLKAYKLLTTSEHLNVESFEKIVLEFLKDYGYIEDYLEEEIEEQSFLHAKNIVRHSFEKNTYFEIWFSDYLYVYNSLNSEIKTKDYNGNDLVFPPKKVTVLCFGKKVSDSEIKEILNETKC